MLMQEGGSVKVAIVTRYFLPVIGGIENHCYNLAKELLRRGIVVEVHTSRDTLTERNALAEYEEIEGIKVFRHRAFWRFIPRSYDIIHLHNFNLFPHFFIFVYVFIKRKICKVSSPKLVITLHGGFTPWWREFNIIARVIKLIYHKTLGRLFLNYVADKIIAVSEWEREQLINEGINSRKIVLIPNGVENEAFTLPKQESEKYSKYKPYLLFIGRITKLKNIDTAIRWLKELRGVNLVIAGPIQDKEYYHYLRKLVADLNLHERVIFLGRVSNEEKYKLIDNALAVILLSHNEGEPITIKEAMARGKPVIVSNIPVFKYLVSDGRNGFIVASREDFKKAVSTLLSCKSLLLKISENNKKVADSWKWPFIAEKLIYIYKGG